MYKILHINRKKLNNKKGFTLIELIVVIAVLGILASVLVPQLSGFTDKARMAQVLTDASAISTVADAIYFENQSEPTEKAIKDMVDVQGDITGIDVKSIGSSNYVLFKYTIKDMGSVERKYEGGKIVVEQVK